MLTWILTVLIGGLIIGALGRLIVPGPNPMGILATTLVGIGGSIVGGIVARLLWIRPQDHFLGLIVLEVLGAALLVLLLTRSRPRSRHRVF